MTGGAQLIMEEVMAWKKPAYKEVCCGFEITKYLPAEL